MLKLFRQWLNRNRESKKYIIYFGQSEFNTPIYGCIGATYDKKIMNKVYGSNKDLVVPNEYTKEEIIEVDEYYMCFAHDIENIL